MKGKVLTSWSLIWLLATVLFVAGGALNLSQRAFQILPPTDGVLWVQKADGIYAEKVTPGLGGVARGHLGRRQTAQRSASTARRPTRSHRPPTFRCISKRPASTATSPTSTKSLPIRSPTIIYFADLKHIDTLPRWTPSIIFLVDRRDDLARRRHLRSVQAGQPFAVRPAFCDGLPRGVCLSHVPLARTSGRISIWRSTCSTISRSHSLSRCSCISAFVIRCEARFSIDSRWKTYAALRPGGDLSACACFSFRWCRSCCRVDSFASALRELDDGYRIFPDCSTRRSFYHFVGGISAGAGVLVWRFFKNSSQTLVRQRLKWAMWGTIAAIVPIVLFQIARRFVYLPDDTSDDRRSRRCRSR